MALTITKEAGGGAFHRPMVMATDDIKIVFGTFTFDSSYASGGESFAPSDAKLLEILFVSFSEIPSGTGGTGLCRAVKAQYDYTNQKVIAVGGSGTSGFDLEIADGVDLSAVTVRFMAVGRK